MPSLFEGLPLAAIEWQLNGLPVVMSDTITEDCIISDKVKSVSLSESYQKWAETIIEISKFNDRESSSIKAQRIAKEKGFDVKDSAKKLRNLYLLK